MENDKHILCVGEASVEFVAAQSGQPLNKVHYFHKRIGGEAALARQIVAYGNACAFLGKIGRDGFGDTICEALAQSQVDFSAISIDAEYETAAAFVAYRKNGRLLERQHINHGADLYLQEKDVGLRVLEKVRLLHFSCYGLLSESARCIASLLTWCLKKDIAVSFALREDCPLHKKVMREAIFQYLGFANIFFAESDQLSRLTGLIYPPFAVKSLFRDNPRLNEIIARDQEEVVFYNRKGEQARSTLPFGYEQDFMALYLGEHHHDKPSVAHFLRAVKQAHQERKHD